MVHGSMRPHVCTSLLAVVPAPWHLPHRLLGLDRRTAARHGSKKGWRPDRRGDRAGLAVQRVSCEPSLRFAVRSAPLCGPPRSKVPLRGDTPLSRCPATPVATAFQRVITYQPGVVGRSVSVPPDGQRRPHKMAAQSEEALPPATNDDVFDDEDDEETAADEDDGDEASG